MTIATRNILVGIVLSALWVALFYAALWSKPGGGAMFIGVGIVPIAIVWIATWIAHVLRARHERLHPGEPVDRNKGKLSRRWLGVLLVAASFMVVGSLVGST